MATNIIIGFVAVTLVAGVLVFLASKTWKVVDVIFLFLVVWAAFFYLTLAMRVLDKRAKYLAEADKLQKELDQKVQENQFLERGVDQERGERPPAIENVEEEVVAKGARRLQHEDQRLTFDRGQVWANCTLAGADPTIARFAVNVPNPVPHQIPLNKILYVFEQGPFQQGARYLGEFRTVAAPAGAPPTMIVLETVHPLSLYTQAELQRITQSKIPWRLYETMPVDSNDILRGLPDEVKQAVFPPSTVNEYLKDGEPAAADDPEDRKVWVNPDGAVVTEENRQPGAQQIYVRRLRDYHLHFSDEFLLRAEMDSKIRDAKQALDSLQTSLDAAKLDLQARETEHTKLQQDADKFDAERKAAIQLVTDLTEQKKNLETRLAALSQENLRDAREFTRRQLEAIRRIDSETAASPPTGG